LALASHEICDKEPVDQETAHQDSGNEAPPGEGRGITPRRATRNLFFNRRWQIHQHSPERHRVMKALEVGLLFEPSSLSSSELRID
jgi:hypothetical protein